MMNLKAITIAISALLITGSATNSGQRSEEHDAVKEINWMTMQEAVEAQKRSEKAIFVDVYTEWCKWCKVMDQQTFTDEGLIDHMNEHYHMVKFDAEQKGALEINGRTFKHLPKGRNGVHELAVELLEGQMSYPAFVIVDRDLKRLGILKGYQTADALISSLNKMHTPG